MINNNFNYEDYNNEFNILKKNTCVTDRDYYYTCFYKISKNNFVEYFGVINKLVEQIKVNNQYDEIDYEVFLPKNLNFNFKQIKNLGVTQNIATWTQCDDI